MTFIVAWATAWTKGKLCPAVLLYGLMSPPAHNKPFPAFGPPQALFAEGSLAYNPTNEWIFPSPIEAAGRLPNPLGRWHMYYSPHDRPGGICLAYADDLRGPWHEYSNNPIIDCVWAGHYQVSHVASPHPLWQADEERLLLWFHGENDTTRLASSADGIHFDYEGVAVTTESFRPDMMEASYARVFEHAMPSKGNRYVMMLMGRIEQTRHIFLAWSEDARQWRTQFEPMISPPEHLPNGQTSAPFLQRLGGQLYVCHHVDWTAPGEPLRANLYATPVDEELRQAGESFVFLAAKDELPDHGRLADAYFAEQDGERYLFYITGRRLEGRIVYAEALV